MGKKYYSRQLLYDYEFDFDDQDNDENFIDFKNFLFTELLYNIKMVPFDHIINSILINDDIKFYDTIEINSLRWLYTADRFKIKNIRIYSFRFPNACNPVCYKSFVVSRHPYFKLSNINRHKKDSWYRYIGDELQECIKTYLKIDKVINARNSYKLVIFVNNKHERLDIEFHLSSGATKERITITFEPGSPV